MKHTAHHCNVFSYHHICLISPTPATHPLRVAPFLQPLRPSLFGVFSGKSLEGGLGGTLVLSRKIHFLFLISFPQRNLNKRFHVIARMHFCSILENQSECGDIRRPNKKHKLEQLKFIRKNGKYVLLGTACCNSTQLPNNLSPYLIPEMDDFSPVF